MTMIPTRDAESARYRMVARDIVGRGVTDQRVIAAMASVPREDFVPPSLIHEAYSDNPLPIGHGQTISQPYIVAAMIEALELDGGRVLEVGTGSGYAAAVLAEIADEVFTIERNQSLAESARDRLEAGGYDNVEVRFGDGTLGWPEQAPFDGIVVAAGGPSVPQALRDQLEVGGHLVVPVGPYHEPQALVRETRRPDGTFEREELGVVRFVPLLEGRDD